MSEDADKPEKPSLLKQRGGIWSVVGVLLVVGIVVVLVLKLTGPGGEEENPRPRYEPPRHLIVISVDTLRADRLGCYGYDKKTSPNIDALAKEGVLFERHYSCYPLTLPAHLTQLTGVSSLGHRVRDNLYHTLPDELATLPEIMQGEGFNTGAFVSAHTMKSGSGIERGFDVYDDEEVRALEPGRLTVRERKADETLKLAEDWISTQGGDQFFCFIHLFDPHAPYEAHAGMGDEFQGGNSARYDGEIAYTDREIGKFVLRLQELGIMDDALLVITSDHGEGLGEHGELTHGYYCHDTTTHVPLIIRGAPGIDSGTRVSGVNRNYDLAPTLVELMGLDAIEFGKQAHGVSLADAMRDPSKKLGLSAYVESHYAWLNANWAKIRGLRTDDALTLFSGEEALHYRGAEGENVAGQHEKAVTAARSEVTRLLNSWMPPSTNVQVRESTAGSPYPGESPVAQSFEAEKLNDTRDLPSPHANVDVLRKYQEAELEYDAERFALCAQKLRELLKDHPDFIMAHKLLAAVNQGVVKRDAGRLSESECVELIREASDSLRVAARLAREHDQDLAVKSINRNRALLAAWLKDPMEFEDLGNDWSVIWMETLARYRAAGAPGDRADIAETAADQIDKMPAGVDFRATAEEHLKVMQRGEAIKLAPWE